MAHLSTGDDQELVLQLDDWISGRDTELHLKASISVSDLMVIS